MGHFIGNTPAVTVQDFQLAKDLFNREEWCGERFASLIDISEVTQGLAR